MRISVKKLDISCFASQRTSRCENNIKTLSSQNPIISLDKRISQEENKSVVELDETPPLSREASLEQSPPPIIKESASDKGKKNI